MACTEEGFDEEEEEASPNLFLLRRTHSEIWTSFYVPLAYHLLFCVLPVEEWVLAA